MIAVPLSTLRLYTKYKMVVLVMVYTQSRQYINISAKQSVRAAHHTAFQHVAPVTHKRRYNLFNLSLAAPQRLTSFPYQ